MSPARALLLLIGLVLLTGCSGWHTERMEPQVAPVIGGKKPVRVTPKDGSPLVLWHPRVVGDSLIGDVGHPPLRTALAFRDLQRLEVLRFSAYRTKAAIVLSAGVIFVISGFYAIISVK